MSVTKPVMLDETGQAIVSQLEEIAGKMGSGGGGGGNADIDLGITGASVGKIIKVKTVDGDGKPLTWEAVTANKSAVGLGNVNNTSDADKPVSTATQEALDGKAASDLGITGATVGQVVKVKTVDENGKPLTFESGAGGGGGGTDAGLGITGASVGEIIKVKTVDGDGKPLTWEAVPMDSTPTENSENTVTSGGVYSAMDTLSNNLIDSGILSKDVLQVKYAETNGILKIDGTIDTSFTNNFIDKYTVTPGDVLYLNGTMTFYVGAGSQWAYLWYVADGEMVTPLQQTESPQVFDDTEITVPEGIEEIWMSSKLTLTKKERINPVDESELESIPRIGEQWKEKTWYGYGTSITNTSSEGKYPTYLAQMSGMTFVNKGISGGGIGNLGAYSTGQVYNAICNVTDGKLNADLITLETGANDVSADVPLGTIYDTGTSTLAGCLNDCIRYLQTNTAAQICVFNSPARKTLPSASTKYYEWAKMVEEICHLNRVHFLNNDCNMGYAKLNSDDGSDYVVDNIHQTELGGYIMAQNLWYQLRNIPLFYTAIPT